MPPKRGNRGVPINRGVWASPRRHLCWNHVGNATWHDQSGKGSNREKGPIGKRVQSVIQIGPTQSGPDRAALIGGANPDRAALIGTRSSCPNRDPDRQWPIGAADVNRGKGLQAQELSNRDPQPNRGKMIQSGNVFNRGNGWKYRSCTQQERHQLF